MLLMLLSVTLYYERCVAQRCLLIGKKTAIVLVSGILSLTHPISPYSIASNSIALPFPLIESVSAISDDNGGISRMRKAREELSSLKKDWMEVVTTKGGDGVRKRLGTVYKPPACELSLCSFPSFVERFIQNNPDLDIDAIEEPARLLSEAYTQSDFYAYSSNFADFGNGGGLYGTSPNSDAYLDKSRAQIERALAALDECLRVIDKR